jgi:S1-C subfamily serine protease
MKDEDLALIKIPNEDRPSNLKAAILKKSKDWKVGDRVVAYGAPRSLPGTLTSGIISHTGRTYWDSPFNDYIQTDTDSNPGNSGGPLINLDGEVIGVMTFGQTPISKKEVVKGSIGLNFAISVNHVIDLIERYSLRGFVHYVSLGLNVEPLRHGGLLVKSIIPGSPADKLLTVMPGDIITRVNNTSFLLEYHDGFDSSTIIRSYKVSVAAMKPGDLASLSIIRGSIANPDKVEVTMPVY